MTTQATATVSFGENDVCAHVREESHQICVASIFSLCVVVDFNVLSTTKVSNSIFVIFTQLISSEMFRSSILTTIFNVF